MVRVGAKELRVCDGEVHERGWRRKRATKVRRWHGVLLCVLFFFYVVIHGQLSAEEALVVGWNYNTSRDLNQYVISSNSTFLMPKTFCESTSFLLLIVCSAPSHFEARNAIRNTWGSRNLSGADTSVFFLLGKTQNDSLQEEIQTESDTYNDIIQENFIDSYNNLTLKTVMMLKLVNNYCANTTKFLFKVDDDMFVNVPKLLKTLHARKRPRNVLLGHLICGAKPIKDSNNKWYAPRYMYPEKIYPNYLSGTGYVMSVDVVPKLYETALKTPLFHLEDVYITGICTKLTDVKPQHNPGFTYQKQPYNPCTFRETITFHKILPADMHEHYATLTKVDLDKLCQKRRLDSRASSWMTKRTTKPKKNKCI